VSEPGSTAQSRFAVITDDAVDQLRRLIGVPIVDTVEPWCYEATRDNIRHHAHGIGDANPLWCDPEYAAGTVYGAVVAPPSFVFALDRVLSEYVGGVAGIHALRPCPSSPHVELPGHPVAIADPTEAATESVVVERHVHVAPSTEPIEQSLQFVVVIAVDPQ
jgi:hypothetical protein